MLRLAAGAVAGAVATAPMTLLMDALHRRLPRRERYALPPREIIEELAERSGAPLPTREDERVLVTLVGHFGYGAACGALYGLDRPRSAGAGALRGVAFGLAVWVVSYVGWLPALRILPAPPDEPAGRTWLMVAAHVVWGAVAGALTAVLTGRRR